MLLLGVLAAQAEAAAPAGVAAYDLLETEILTGSQSSVTFSSLNSTYGADYQHLQIRWLGRSTVIGTFDYTQVIYNSDSGSNYSSHYLYANGSTVASAADTNRTFAYYGAVPGANSTPSEAFSAHIIDILDAFETTKAKTTRILYGVHTGLGKGVELNSSRWGNTNALDSIEIGIPAGSFVVGSRFSLYGLKASA